MPKTFYTERDIEDMARQGITSLILNDDIVVTDLARERAHKLGFEFVKQDDIPARAPVRPYIAKPVEKPVSHITPSPPTLQISQPDMEQRVLEAVKAKLGDSVDPRLLETIIKRVLHHIEGT